MELIVFNFVKLLHFSFNFLIQQRTIDAHRQSNKAQIGTETSDESSHNQMLTQTERL